MSKPVHTSFVLKQACDAVGKRISAYFTMDGSIGLVRTKDGQAYEIEIRPAMLSKFQPFREQFGTGNSKKKLR